MRNDSNFCRWNTSQTDQVLFGAMRNGATSMQFYTGISIDIISIIQALILIFIAADAIIRRLYRIRVRDVDEQVTVTRGWGS